MVKISNLMGHNMNPLLDSSFFNSNAAVSAFTTFFVPTVAIANTPSAFTVQENTFSIASKP
jgi:hypothetical protein